MKYIDASRKKVNFCKKIEKMPGRSRNYLTLKVNVTVLYAEAR